VAACLRRVSGRIARAPVDQLRGRELPGDGRARLTAAAVAVPGVDAVHALRTRQSGMDTFVQIHVELDGGMRMYQAHVIADLVEAEVQQIHPGTEVFVHLDPSGAEDFAESLGRVTSAEMEAASMDASGHETTNADQASPDGQLTGRIGG